MSTLSRALTFHTFPNIANNTTLTRGPSPEAILLTTALAVYKELQSTQDNVYTRQGALPSGAMHACVVRRGQCMLTITWQAVCNGWKKGRMYLETHKI